LLTIIPHFVPSSYYSKGALLNLKEIIMTSTFFFYDLETFGLNPKEDRIAQFAGIRTDSDFNIIGDPINIYCQPPEDYIPDPESILITGITPEEAREKGLPEAQFAAHIHEEFSQPNTCILG